MNHLNLFKIKFKIVSNIHWLKDSLSECHTIFVRIIFSWNYTRRMESQKYIYLDNIFGIHDKILGARSRAKNQNSSGTVLPGTVRTGPYFCEIFPTGTPVCKEYRFILWYYHTVPLRLLRRKNRLSKKLQTEDL